MAEPDSARGMLRHVVATIAYRAAKALRGAPEEFAAYKAGPTTRTPIEIVAHMGDLFNWSLTLLRGESKWNTSTPLGWTEEQARFFATLRAFDDYLVSGAPLALSVERVFQGPVADALTHTGQLAMLRRMAGVPMKGESYARATIEAGRVGPDQVPIDPKFEFD